LVEDENRPRYQNIRWYLDAIGLDFQETVKVINKIPRLYK
jgi:glutamine---fructose-6-phosphate transaminase (isomerizing)